LTETESKRRGTTLNYKRGKTGGSDMAGNYRRMGIALSIARKEVKKLTEMLQACHEANLLRMQALKDAGVPDPVDTGEEEE
jgi:hypothetical protein